ncbi:MAG: hypothetical protein AMJ42_05960 [Deltaproteobacteria bacterium DG_8]|nr:MAG: hypothetical protein AMJ42_05960 [Deltaproteobacteria bacterium DG_8]
MGVLIEFSCIPGTSMASSSGYYYHGGIPNGTCIVTPSKSGYTFDPPSRSVIINNDDESNINFTGYSTTSTTSITTTTTILDTTPPNITDVKVMFIGQYEQDLTYNHAFLYETTYTFRG